MSKSESYEDALIVVRVLEEAGIPYILVGSLSSNAWGIPRATKDADFVIATGEPIALLRRALAPRFVSDGQLGFETVTGHLKYVFRNALTGFEVELFLLADDAFSQERFRRRVRREAGDTHVWLPTAEDVIVQKLRWARAKDYLDVLDVMAVQEGHLDWVYIEKWCKELGSLPLLAKARAEVTS